MRLRITGGEWRGRWIRSPKGQDVRPTLERLRSAVFDALQTEIEGAHFCDLFSGSGAMGLEALSRGASKAFFCERSPLAYRCIEENILSLEASSQSILIRGDALKTWKRLPPIDILYVDPPYHNEKIYSSVTQILHEHPLVKKGGWILFEMSSHLKWNVEEWVHSEGERGINHYSTKRYGDTLLHIGRMG